LLKFDHISKKKKNNRVLSRHLKLSVLSVGSCRSAGSRQLGGNSIYPMSLRAQTVSRVQRGNDAWQKTKVSSTGHIRDRKAVVHQVLGCLVVKAVMHQTGLFFTSILLIILKVLINSFNPLLVLLIP